MPPEVNGKIALVDVTFSGCYAVTRVQTAQAAGAIAVILINPPELGDYLTSVGIRRWYEHYYTLGRQLVTVLASL
jgi:hypothetical protein